MHPDLHAALVRERILQRRDDAANARCADLARQVARAGREHPPDRPRLGAARAELGFLLIEAGLHLALAERPRQAPAAAHGRRRARRMTTRS